MKEKKSGMGSHHSAKMGKDEWLTPPGIVEALGPFDLDPCAPVVRPWDTASRHFTIEDDGLAQPWVGRVWCNPPYGAMTGKWLDKLAAHGNGIALIFARTETAMFFSSVWRKADAVLFLEGRIHFHHVTGEQAPENCGAPSVLVAYGEENVRRLEARHSWGQFLRIPRFYYCHHESSCIFTHPDPEYIGDGLVEPITREVYEELKLKGWTE